MENILETLNIKTKEYNKSLSARIKRRNNQGFYGAGTTGWKKSNDFGTYIKEKKEPTVQDHIITMCKRLGINRKHCGSKPVSRLLKSIKTYNKALAWSNKINRL